MVEKAKDASFYRDAITIRRSFTSDVDVFLSGLPLGSMTRDQIVKFSRELTAFLNSNQDNEVVSPPIKLPSLRQQEQIISSTGM